MLSIYLNFNGNCREAFDFYRTVFGGEFAVLETFRNMPPGEISMQEEELDKVMHVSYPIGSSVLMGSDVPSGFGPPHVSGNNFSVSVSPESREEANRIFGALSEGGNVTMELQDMFWGSYFGSCTDRFGVNWQVNCEQAQD